MDLVGGANLIDGSSFSFVEDRFGNPNSAIYLNQGYLKVPPGVYFEGDFTITAWINLKNFSSFSPIIDFGNGPDTIDNILLSVRDATFGAEVYFNRDRSFMYSDDRISLNKWYFVAFSMVGMVGSLYLDGKFLKSSILLIPRNEIRVNNFIGINNLNIAENKVNAVYSSIKIYKNGLTSEEIKNEFNNVDEISQTSYLTTKTPPTTSTTKSVITSSK